MNKQQKYRLLKDSYLFDETWYLAVNRDVLEAGIDPVEHYLEYGWMEKRDPSRYFSTLHYLENNDDVNESKINPLVHYIVYGLSEGRSIKLSIVKLL